MAYTKKTLDEIKTNIVLNIVNNVDGINDANIGSVLDLFVTSMSEELEEQYTDLDTIYEGSRITTAADDDLEEIGAIVGVDRNEGSKSAGEVSFIRNSPTSTAFNINSGTIVSVQPNSQDEDFQYVTTENIVFPTAIAAEEQLFINGIYTYKFEQRFADSITDITGTVSAAPHTFVQDTDYELINDYEGIIIDVTNLVDIDDCETAGNWTEGDEADACTANTSEYIEGTQSLNLLKSATTDTKLSYTATLGSSKDLSDLKMYMKLFVKDSTVLSKINEINIWAGSNSGIINSYKATTDVSDLTESEWNTLILNRFDSDIIIAGNPDTKNINFLKIEVTLNSTSDTLVAGDLMMDFWFFADHENYEGDVILFDKAATIPDNNTNISADYVPLSMEIAVEAQEIGVGYNAAKGKIIYKVSNVSNIDRIYNYESLIGGLDVETDDNFRVRIQNATNLKTNATANAIRFNVLDLDFVGSVNVIDTPDKSSSNEPHTFATGTDVYVLSQEVAQDNANMVITGTLSATPGHTFVKGTDYVLTEYNEIDWSVGGDSPDNATLFYVAYDYKWLGHFDVYVVGKLGQLTANQLEEVETTVEETRSAGTVPNVIEPTYVVVDVSATLTYSDGANTITTKANVETAVKAYIDDLGVGEDVLLAGVINVTMSVDGVENVSVTDIGSGGAADYTIASDEVAQSNVVTLS